MFAYCDAKRFAKTVGKISATLLRFSNVSESFILFFDFQMSLVLLHFFDFQMSVGLFRSSSIFKCL